MQLLPCAFVYFLLLHSASSGLQLSLVFDVDLLFLSRYSLFSKIGKEGVRGCVCVCVRFFAGVFLTPEVSGRCVL